MADERKVIDWEQMDMIADGYSQEFVEICREFIGEIPGLFGTLETICEGSDIAKAARVSHQIKGSASNFGFIGVSVPMAALEAVAKSGSLENFSGYLEEARANFDQGCAELLAKRGVQL